MIRDVYAASRQERKKARHARAWVNGIDVSNECYYADDRRGIARVYRRDGEGYLHVDQKTGGPAQMELRGQVRIGRA